LEFGRNKAKAKAKAKAKMIEKGTNLDNVFGRFEVDGGIVS